MNLPLSIASIIAILSSPALLTTVVNAQPTEPDYAQYLQSTPADNLVGTRHFRVGAMVGFNLKADFSMGGTFSVSGNNPGAAGISGQNHTYDNGYVRVDANGNADSSTWNWGYQNAGQYNAGTERLTFSAVDSFTTSGGGGTETGDPQVGVETSYGGHLTRWGQALVGWELGIGFLPVKITQRQNMLATVSQTIHSYDASGFSTPDTKFPDAPYQGTFTGPGALIYDTAQTEVSPLLTGVPLTSEQTLDVTLYSFRLGPTLHWELSERLATAVSLGAALGVVSGELEFNEQLQLPSGVAYNSGAYSSTEIVYGGYLSASLMFHAEEHGDFYLGVQYMPMSSATFSGGGREATLNLSGAVYISAGVNWPF
jgi:hypothetical protein